MSDSTETKWLGPCQNGSQQFRISWARGTFSSSSQIVQPDSSQSARLDISTNQRFGLGGVPNVTEQYARMHRSAAAFSEATFIWRRGQLPFRSHGNTPTYSPKIFLGGVPWDITEKCLHETFKAYGLVRVEWPGRDVKPRFKGYNPSKVDYLFLVLESGELVKNLLGDCTRDVSTNEWFFRLPSQRLGSKDVQVVPWLVSDIDYHRTASGSHANKYTVFVGALHGLLTAENLFHVMDDIFGNVKRAHIDTDQYKYPIGSGRVTFDSQNSYMEAVKAAFVKIQTVKFSKNIQIDPIMDKDATCSSCQLRPGRYFCRKLSDCFKYFCRLCWNREHFPSGEHHNHHQIMLNEWGRM